jgi:hypothetical protein
MAAKIYGKTERLLYEVITRLSELPENQKVYITGPHLKWTKQFVDRLKSLGLVDVEMIPIESIKKGGLRGITGILLIDEFDDIPYEYQDMLIAEKRLLERRSD